MKHLVMVGSGPAHLHMLSTLAAQRPAGTRITLVAPYPVYFHPGMLAGYVTGQHLLEDCSIALAPLLAGSDLTWLLRSPLRLDASSRSLMLDDGSRLEFDVLSIDSGALHDRQKIEQQMPGAREHALFAYPAEAFGKLWPQVIEFAQDRPLRVAVLGAGQSGIEMALAVAHRLPGTSVTLLTGDAVLAASYPPALQARIVRALQQRHITVIRETACGIAADEVRLSGGAQLACDVPIIALDAQAPAWLQDSGVALDAQGFASVDRYGRSTSHAEVFAASGTEPLRASLNQNLRAVLAGVAPATPPSAADALNFLACDERTAMVSWGNLSAQGRWVGWLKTRRDKRFIAQYRRTAAIRDASADPT